MNLTKHRRKVLITNISIIVSVILIAVLVITGALFSVFNVSEKIDNVQSTLSYAKKYKKKEKKLNKSITDKDELIRELEAEIQTKDKQIAEMETAKVKEIKSYFNLVNKYSYVINYKQNHKGSKADLGVDEILYLNELSKRYPNIKMEAVLSVIELESGFNSRCENPNSTAVGYGQMLAGTAKSVYEKMLHRGTYNKANHTSLAKNKKLNLEMTYAYLSRNKKTYGSTKSAVMWYFGHPDGAQRQSYANVINKNLSRYGYNLSNID